MKELDLSIAVIGSGFRPEKITLELGLNPTSQISEGERISQYMPDVAKKSSWVVSKRVTTDFDLSIDAFIQEIIVPNIEVIKRYRSSGLIVQMRLGLFTSDTFDIDLNVETVIKPISASCVSLLINTYLLSEN